MLLARHRENYLVTQEIIAVDSEADVRTRWEVIHSVKGKFTKSNLERFHRKKNFFFYTPVVEADFLFTVTVFLSYS